MRSESGERETVAPRGSELDRWLARLLPRLVRWAHRKLPPYARRRMDTGDLVQEALVSLLRHLPELEEHGPAALRNYVLQTIRNRIRDEIRRAGKVELAGGDADERAGEDASPLARAIAHESEDRYRAALARLSAVERGLVSDRLERGLDYAELAAAHGKRTPDAARVATKRAIVKLVRMLEELDSTAPDDRAQR